MCGYGSSSFEGKGASAGFHSDYSLSLLPELQMHQKKGMTLLKTGVIIDNNNFLPDVPDCTVNMLFAHIPLMAGYNYCLNSKLSVSLCGGLAYSWNVNYYITDYPDAKSHSNSNFLNKSSGLTTIHELNQRKGESFITLMFETLLRFQLSSNVGINAGVSINNSLTDKVGFHIPFRRNSVVFSVGTSMQLFRLKE